MGLISHQWNVKQQLLISEHTLQSPKGDTAKKIYIHSIYKWNNSMHLEVFVIQRYSTELSKLFVCMWHTPKQRQKWVTRADQGCKSTTPGIGFSLLNQWLCSLSDDPTPPPPPPPVAQITTAHCQPTWNKKVNEISKERKQRGVGKERRWQKRCDCGQNNIVKKTAAANNTAGIKTRGWSIFRGTGIFEVWIGFKRLGFIEFVRSSHLFSEVFLSGTAITPVQNNAICKAPNIHFPIRLCPRGIYSTLWSSWRCFFVFFSGWLRWGGRGCCCCAGLHYTVQMFLLLCPSGEICGSLGSQQTLSTPPPRPTRSKSLTKDWFCRACPCKLASTT